MSKRIWFASLAALLLCASPGLTAPGVGDVAPAYVVKECINSPNVTLADLKGQVILFEIWRTW